MEFDVQALAFLTGAVIPILVGLLTKLNASARVKSFANAGLSAVSGALMTVIANSGRLVWSEFVTSVGTTWVISIATYYGLYKPSGVSAAVQEKTADVGIG